MNVSTTVVASSDGFSEQQMTFIGIVVSVIIQILLCAERAFSRVQKSSCRRDANGALSVTVESKEAA